jgi:lipopolysaccharide transport system ATP-binding protein
LKDGRVERYGSATEVSQAYLAYHEEKSARAKRPYGITDAAAAAAAGYYAIKSFELVPGESVPEHSSLEVVGEVFSPDGRPPVIMIGLVRADGTPVYGVTTDMDGVAPIALAADRFEFGLDFPALPLLPGKYFVRLHVLDPEGLRMFDTLEKSLTVTGVARELGLVRIEHRWKVDGTTAETSVARGTAEDPLN